MINSSNFIAVTFGVLIMFSVYYTVVKKIKKPLPPFFFHSNCGLCYNTDMEAWRKFKSYILKDVDNANEAKRMPVLVRVLSLSFCLYFLIAFVMIMITNHSIISLVMLVGIALYFLPFYLSYRGHSRIARGILIYFTPVWVALSVYNMGWNSGFENFFYVLLILIFMTGYAPIAAKVAGAGIIAAIRLAIYFFMQAHPAVHYIPPDLMRELQVLNTITVFAQVTVLVTLFSLDSLESEKKLMDYNDKVKEMASVDPLTGLMNRRGMETYIARQVKNTSENQGFLNFAIGDIDFFKRVNDTYGHASGDELLKKLADIFRDFMREKGMVARWGGEEFLFLFLGENGDQTMIDLEDLRQKIERTEFDLGDQKIHATMTFGMQEWNIGESYERTISEADKKLYQGKEQGRNQVVF